MEKTKIEDMKYEKLADLWLEREKNFLKISTYSTYKNLHETHIKPVFGNEFIGNISNESLQQFIFDKLKNGRLDGNGGLSRKTVKDIMTIIKISINYAVRENIIKEKSLKYKIPKTDKIREISIFTQKEQSLLFKYIASNPTSKSVGILLAMSVGLRIGELCGLKWKDIDLKNEILIINKTIQRIYIKGKKEGKSEIIISTPKSKSSYRIIPLSRDLINLLKFFQINDKNNYFLSNNEKYIEPKTYRRYYYKILEKLKIRKLKFHSLRHTFATTAIESGIDYKTVSEILGHASVNTTLELYTHPKIEHKKKCIELIFQNFEKR
ncbi:tyrosine-type recombinase/integrase [Pseudoleptotrichia goodfellowii]|uniref:Site-specific recombinase, phage integrase family n=1 Tax=Pseudoleptotrichia goodfellowii TaxID=157692 RepID=A0A510JDN6_9FUSO|nr:site-specific integrase [Pseudoleptotrichia goodfellowii]BBM36173.1 site-specific recombinase, phage integrase family [Pseudoleptotrichia goodfellowii]